MLRPLASIACFAVLLSACGRTPVLVDSGRTTAPFFAEDPWEIPDDGRLRVAIIGDYGTGDSAAASVRDLVVGWKPDYILTVGDNNYGALAPEGWQQNVGDLYGSFLGSGDENRFLACSGNNDWSYTDGLSSYSDYFDLPGNERYYAVYTPNVDLFCLSSDALEPDGNGPTSVQAMWLRDQLASSTAPWQLVYLHHPTLSSGSYGNSLLLDWPFAAWGADFVWSGHEHNYERSAMDGVLFGVQGLGGISPRSMRSPQPASRFAWTQRHAATLAQIGPEVATFTTVSSANEVVDIARVQRGVPLSSIHTLVPRHASWSFALTEPGPTWTQSGFDSSTWPVAPAPLTSDNGLYGRVDWGNPGARPITRWFRTTFDVIDTDPLHDLVLELVAWDGAVVWLNGTRIASKMMPLTVTANTPATSVSPLEVQRESLAFDIDSALLQEGQNVLAVEVHLASANSLSGGMQTTLRADVSKVLVPMGGTWSYAVGDVSEDWMQPAFLDATWRTGRAPLGYPAGKVSTSIPSGTDRSRPAVSRFRMRFDVEERSRVDALMLEGLRGEGAVVWLNGEEVWRSNVGQRAVEEGGFAPVSLPEGWAEVSMQTQIDASALRTGANVLAVQVHVGDDWQDQLIVDLGLRAVVGG